MSLKIKLIASAVSLTFVGLVNAATYPLDQAAISAKTIDVSGSISKNNTAVFNPTGFPNNTLTFNDGSVITGTIINDKGANAGYGTIDIFEAWGNSKTITNAPETRLDSIDLTIKGNYVLGSQSLVVFQALAGKINLETSNSIKIDASGSGLEQPDAINGIVVQNDRKNNGSVKLTTGGDLSIITTSATAVVGTLIQPSADNQDATDASLELNAKGVLSLTSLGYTKPDGTKVVKGAVSIYDQEWQSENDPVYYNGKSSAVIHSDTAVNIQSAGYGAQLQRKYAPTDGSTDNSSSDLSIDAPAVSVSGDLAAVVSQSVAPDAGVKIDGAQVTLKSTKADSDKATVAIEGNSKIEFGTNESYGKQKLTIDSANGQAIKTAAYEGSTNGNGAVTFNNVDATINGDVDTSSGELTLNKDTRVELQGDSTFNAGNIVTDGSATLVTNYSKTDGKAIQLNSVISDGKTIAIKTGGSLADDIGTEAAAERLTSGKIISGDGASSATLAGGESGHAAPSYSLVKNEDGTYTTVLGTNEQMDAIKSFSAMTLTQWRNEISTLTERLGDVRDNRQAAGAWARVYGASTKVTDGATTKTTTNSIQVGADYSINPNWLVGGAFSYTNADGSFSVGSGDADGYTLAAYATGFFDCGGYIDLVGRIGRLSSDVKVAYSDGAVFDGSYDNTAYGLSAEVGWKYNVTKSVFVEPQAQLSYSYISGDDYQGADVRIEQDNFQSLVGRLGARAGFNFPKDAGQFYLTASVNHDFKGDADSKASVSGSSVAFDENVDLGGTWVSYGFGLQFAPSKNLSVYGSLTRANGNDYQDNYRYSLGARYIF